MLRIEVRKIVTLEVGKIISLIKESSNFKFEVSKSKNYRDGFAIC
jgi:hypothetical protein